MTESAQAGTTRGPSEVPALSVDDRAVLEAERNFLLDSIGDLTAEHEAGELSDRLYEDLTSGYTARAARILRALQRGPAQQLPGEEKPSRPSRRRLAVLLSLVAVASAAAVFLPSALSERRAGQTITGNQQSGSDVGATLASAVEARPDDADARRAYARFLLEAGNQVEALIQFDEASRLDPTDAESRAYAGWIVFLAGLPADALERLDGAVAVDPDYPDARFFRGMVLAGDVSDPAAAVAELRSFLELDPATSMLDEVEQIIAELETVAPGGAPPATARSIPVDG